MKILFLNHNVARRGGTFFRAYHVARHLVRLGHSVTLITISPDRRFGFQREESDGITLIHSPDLLWGTGRTGWDIWDTCWRIAFLHGKSWDIVHAWDCRPVVILPALYARYQSGDRSQLVIDWCDWFGRGGTQAERPAGLVKTLYSPIETFFEERFRKFADGTTVISKLLAERAVSVGVPQSSIRLLRQGCEPEDAATITDRSRSRIRLQIASDHHLLLSVGALLQADATLLFAALRQLLPAQPICRFVLIGKHGAKVPADISSMEQFQDVGFVSEDRLRDYLQAADALLVPLADSLASRARWPSKVNPFLSAGRAVVITRVGDFPCWLERERAAKVVAAEPQAIAEGVCELMNHPEQLAEYEKRGRQLAEQQLTWGGVVQELESFYKELHARS